jgi:thiamine biosynthesis protein ThiI
MINQLRDRIEERLAFDGIDGEVTPISGRLVVTTDEAIRAADALAELPGVASTSPAFHTDPTIQAIEAASDRLSIGSTFGVDANVGGDHPFDSPELNDRIGSRIQERTGATVDLDEPETWVELDVRRETAYLFTRRFDGPGGFPVGVQRPVAALISGGIDSPVAAYEMLTRGAPIVPIYFYNRPFASEDHLARFEAVLDKLVRFHPAGEWGYHLIDMEEPNEALLEVGRGRMLLHRRLMFRVARRIADDGGLAGLVTGESIGQKSSQTTANLELTAAGVSGPIYRPLLTVPKAAITDRARSLGTFEEATIPSACRSLAPESPATTMEPAQLDSLAEQIGLESLVETAYLTAEYRPRSTRESVRPDTR